MTRVEAAAETGLGPHQVRYLDRRYCLGLRLSRKARVEWTPKRAVYLVRLAEQGQSAAQIAARLGVAETTVRRWAGELGATLVQRRSGRAPLDVAALRECAARGLSARATAQALGASDTGVRRVAARHGIEFGGTPMCAPVDTHAA